MNNYYITDENYTKSKSYQAYLNNNKGRGILKIRASAANQAIPISNLKITVSTIIDNNNVIFYEGYTNTSGVIENITLPAPVQNRSDLVTPANATYDVTAIYESNMNQNYKVNIYDNIVVIQNINIVPPMKVSGAMWQ